MHDGRSLLWLCSDVAELVELADHREAGVVLVQPYQEVDGGGSEEACLTAPG